MKKQEFLEKIKNGIKNLPKSDIETHLQYYSEMIDDRVEDGIDEESAVAAAGDVDTIVKDILQEKSNNAKAGKNPFRKCFDGSSASNKVHTNMKPFLLKSLLWLGRALTAVVFFAVIIGLFVASVSVSVAGLAGVVASAVMLFNGVASLKTLVLLGVSLAAMGVSVLFFILTKCCVKASSKLLKSVENKQESEKEEL